MKLTLIPCEPTGSSTGIGCGPGGCRPVTLPTYASTPEGKRLRDVRHAKRLTLGVLRSRFGLSPAEMSGLERGSSTLTEWGWKRLFAWLESVTACAVCDGRGRIQQRLCKACGDGAVPIAQVPP